MALQPEFQDQQLVQLAGVIPCAPLVAVQQPAYRSHLDERTAPGIRRFERVVEQLAERTAATHPQADWQAEALFLLAPDFLGQGRHHRPFEQCTFLQTV